jgi:hypothetical protein
MLVEGVDYNLKAITKLIKRVDIYINSQNVADMQYVADLADCRPLLTVEIDGVEWTELDFVKYTVGHFELLGMVVFRNNHFGFYTVEKIQEFTTFETVKNSNSKIEKLDMTLDDYIRISKENYDGVFEWLGIKY